MKGIIWYCKPEPAAKKLQSIIDNYQQLGYKIVQGKTSHCSGSMVVFDNDDVWRTVPAHDKARGHRCNISLVSRSIPPGLIDTIIRPCTIALPYHAIDYWREEE